MTVRLPREPDDLVPIEREILETIDEGTDAVLVGGVYRLADEDDEELPEKTVRGLVERGLVRIGRPRSPESPEGAVALELTPEGEDALAG